MNHFIESFYELMHKNAQRRRRMFSLLLVLSIFVTSGVVWVLRGTGITLVNVEYCGIEAHTHTEECYESILMCGLPEDDTHTHTEECYDKHLICGLEEHQHTAECYSETPTEEITLLENLVSETAEANEITVFDEALPTEESADGEEIVTEEQEEPTEPIETAQPEETEEELFTEEQPPLRSVNPKNKRQLTDLPDTRKDGIIINLFDYGTDELDSAQSDFYNPQYVGINKGKKLNDDILFFAYGTPADPVVKEADGYDEKNSDKQHFIVENGRVKRNLTKNNYSGDYRTDVDANGVSPYVSGNRPVQGIVNPTLTNGYPTIAGSNHSLDYLFNTKENGDAKHVYRNVGNLLMKDADQYYYYDSNLNYVYYNPEQGNNGNFIVYEDTFYLTNADHHLANTTDNKGNSFSSEKNPMKIGFFPFDDYDNQKSDPNWNGAPNGRGSVYNHHFGMTLEADFQIPTNEGHKYMGSDVIFEYSGDDDMWVFVDDVLVLDVGGIHEPAAGKVNFSTGQVLVEDEAFATTTIDGKKWMVSSLEDIFEAAGKEWDYTAQHHIDMFYLERGGCYSNLSMKFNLPTIKTISVSKDLDHRFHTETDYDQKEYSFRLHQKNSATSEDDIIYMGDYEHDGQYSNLAATNGIFKIKPGADVAFHGLDQSKYYYVEELDVNSSIFSDILVNGDIVSSLQADTGLSDVSTPPLPLDKNLGYDFTNKVQERSTDIEVQKNWSDGAQNHTNDKAMFQLIRTDETGRETALIIEGRKTFVLNAENNWHMGFSNLVTRYGEHTYTYSVIEEDVPVGYTVSYSTSQNADGDTIYNITNVSNNRVEMHIKKIWVDTFGNELTTHPDQITAKLERHYIEYGNPETVPLIIKVENQNGKQIGIWETKQTFLGGSIEFSLEMPPGGNVLSTTAQDCNVFYSDEVFEVSEIQEGAEITITVQEAAKRLLMQHSFTGNNMNGWSRFNEGASRHSDCPKNIKGPLKVELSGANYYATGNALLVSGREGGFYQGAKTIIPQGTMEPGKTYGFSLYAYAESNTEPEFHLVMKYYTTDGNEHYDHIVDVTTRSNRWVHLCNPNFTMPPDWDDTRETLVYIETAQGHAEFDNFRLDEFVITDGGLADLGTNRDGTPYMVEADTPDPLVHYSFSAAGDGTDGWSRRGSETVARSTAASYDADGASVLVSNRSQNWNGAQHSLNTSTYLSGSTHSFSVYAMSPTDTTFLLQLQYNLKDGNNSTTQYPTIAEVSAKAGEWVQLSNNAYRMPDNIDTSKALAIYVNTTSGTGNFYIDEFVESPNGYESTVMPLTGEVVLRQKDYGVNLFEDTIIAPKKIISEGDDTDFNNANKNIVLNANNSWKKDWTTQQLNERNDRSYIYTVTELSDNPEYSVSYVRNGSSSNTSDTPMLIRNTRNAYTLPATGGNGTKRISILGLGLILLSILSAGYVRRRERRSG